MFPAPDMGPAPALRHGAQPFAAFPRKRPSLTDRNVFRFLNREIRIQSAADWNDSQAEALWLYNLHYFDDLCANGAAARRAWHETLIARWIAENPVGQGMGWNPYPLSLRVVNWIKWSLECGALCKEAMRSLAVQARYLAPRVELHLLGNHMFANAKALVFAGCFFEGAEAEEWLQNGLAMLREQLAEQVLADGGHFERSPMYQAIVLEDVLDMINLSRCFPGALAVGEVRMLQEAARRMLGWARGMRHPDGGIAFFNDAAFGIAPEVAELENYAERLGIAENRHAGASLVCLEQSGYVRLARGPYTVLFDAAPVGPDYLPGHAHADTLAFELSHGTQRVICNSGTSRYGRDEMRLWERSTAAHSSVEIDGENSSEVWSGFRVARRAYPIGLTCVEDGNALRLSCAHDGYARLCGRPIHRRTIEVSDNAIQWTDEVTGAGVHRVVGRIPLHPSVCAERVSESMWKLKLASGDILSVAIRGMQRGATASNVHPIHENERAAHAAEPEPEAVLGVEEGRYSPEFGLTMERQVLVWVAEGPLPISISLQLAAY